MRLRWVLGLGALTILGSYALSHRGGNAAATAPAAADTEADERAPASDPKAILGRVWFDKLPSKRTDEVSIAIWFGGGVGVYEHGSSFRGGFDVFEFERRGSRVDMTFFQDKKKAELGFEVKRCDDKPPFDLCLTFTDAPPRGPKTLYGFSYYDDEANAVPWSRDLVKAARARAAMR